MADLSYAEVSRLLKADFQTGKLYWLPRTPDMFEDGDRSAEHKCNIWNAQNAGNETFLTQDDEGYHKGIIWRRYYRAHRVVWLLAYGDWPADQIDHINGVKSDNRLANLRDVNNATNGRNQKRSSRNKSGVTGVFWDNRAQKWGACIMVNGRNKFLGSFTDKSEAAKVRKCAEEKHGYHANHGSA